MATPTMVRNTAAGPTVFAADRQHVEWAGAGDPMGGDLQPVPSSFTESVDFHRMVARGIFVIETAEEAIAAALGQHKADWEQRLERQRSAAEASIDPAPRNDSVIKPCLGPSGKDPRGTCGIDVPIKASKLGETPPLCPMHGGLAGGFLATEGEKLVEGRPEVVWVPLRLGTHTQQD